MKNELAFYVDMDGVLCDFVGGVRELLACEEDVFIPTDADWPKGEYDICNAAKITPKLMWTYIDKCPEFWERLAIMPEAIEMFSELQGIGRTFVCTSPSLHASCVAGKLRWLQKLFGYPFRDYVFTTHKELLAHPNAILIDDHDQNCKKFVDCGGRAILYPQPWNSSHGMMDLLNNAADPMRPITKKAYIMQGVELALGLDPESQMLIDMMKAENEAVRS